MRTLWTALASLALATTSLAQLSGRFSLEKSTFAPGEPIVLSFKTTNQSTQPQSVPDADPYTFCSGISIHVSSDPKPTSSCGIRGQAGDCPITQTTLEPGRSQTDHLLVNFEHNLTRPGDYVVDANKSLVLNSSSDPLRVFIAPRQWVQIRQQFHLHIVKGATPPPGTFNSLAAQLHSSDKTLRREAARTLATFAPPSLEATLLQFPHQPEFQEFAPLALHNLNTPRSISALAQMLVDDQPGTYVHMQAAEFLAQADHRAWYPLLRRTAQHNPTFSAYPAYAAESGGHHAIPFLLQLTRSPDREATAGNAVMALGATGSRAAIPVLLQILRDPDRNIAERAEDALMQLTHLRISEDARKQESPAATQLRWSTWWRTSGPSAHIYKAEECSEYKPLP